MDKLKLPVAILVNRFQKGKVIYLPGREVSIYPTVKEAIEFLDSTGYECILSIEDMMVFIKDHVTIGFTKHLMETVLKAYAEDNRKPITDILSEVGMELENDCQ